jgi:EAL domain-containing protein (putative c-di-GMP-specific phosphodiesterase class I)
MRQPLLIDRVLGVGGIRAVLQPVYDISRAQPVACGVECLSRGPAGSNAEIASVLFDYVRRKKREAAVDRACIDAALRACTLLHDNLRVGLNVHGATLARDEGFAPWMLERLAEAGISPARVVLEIVEHAPAQDLESLAAAIASLRKHGVRLALDDVGLGSSGLRMVVEWQPDFIKIDRFFVSQAPSDKRRRAVIESVVALAAGIGAVSVAEGVETQEQLDLVTQSGVRLVQGYVFCEPLPPDELQRRTPSLFADGARCA